MNLILASASPRRRELLSSLGLDFEVITSDVEELLAEGETPHDYVSRLAHAKARAVASGHEDRWVIAADTVVNLDKKILEKPRDEKEAASMLALIAGRTHRVFTGLTLMNLQRPFEQTLVEITEVTISRLSRQQIDWYVKTGEPLDKAGSYAVQGLGAMFIESIRGNYTNVVGLPLSTLVAMMRKAGIDPLGSETDQE